MYSGEFSSELKDLLAQYAERWGGVGTLDIPPSVTHDELVERIRRALAENKPIDGYAEYYSPEFKQAILNGDILL